MLRRISSWALALALLSMAAGWLAATGDGYAELPAAAPLAGGGSWRSGGPYGGDVQALALSPAFATDGLALAGGWRSGAAGVVGGYGLARTTDSGASWTPVFVSPPYDRLTVFDLAFSPAFSTDRVAFAATGDGLLRSRDGAQTWQRLGGGLPEAGSDLSADDIAFVRVGTGFPAALLLAGTTQGALYRSADGGETWSKLSPDGVTAVLPPASGSHVLFAAAFDGATAHLLRSADDGGTWATVYSRTGTRVNDLLAASGGALLAATDGGLLRLVPEGANWVEDPAAATGAVVGETNRLAPAGDGIYAAAQGGLYLSTDYGVHWQRVAGTPAGAFQSVAPCPQWTACQVVFAGTRAGILAAGAHTGDPWLWLPGPHALPVRKLAASPGYAADGTLFAATDHGLYRSTDAGDGWQLVAEGDDPDHDYTFANVQISPAYAGDGTVFAVYVDRATAHSALYKSTDRGETWSVQGDTAIPLDAGGILALSPAYETDHTVFAGKGDLIAVSSDGGLTWATHPLAVPSDGFVLSDLAVSPAYATDHTLFAAGFGAARRSTDGGLTWQVLGTRGPSYVIAVSPAYAADGTLWQTYRALVASESAETPESGVWRSADGGESWQWATAGLPGAGEPFALPLAVSPADAAGHALFAALGGQLAAGASHSLYVSLDGGDGWTEMGAAPGNPDVFDLDVSADAGDGLVVHLATAAGAWHYQTQSVGGLANGGFETDAAWQFLATGHTAAYSTARAHSGQRSLAAGIDAGADQYSYSDAYQTVTIPAGVGYAALDFWWYPQSAEGMLAAPGTGEPEAYTRQRMSGAAAPDGVLAGDRQYLLLLDDTGTLLASALWGRRDDRTWLYSGPIDLTRYAGKTLRIQFGVYNDGDGRSSAMFVDDVALQLYWQSSPTPTRTPAARSYLYLPVVLAAYAPSVPAPMAAPTPVPAPAITPAPAAMVPMRVTASRRMADGRSTGC